MTQQHADTDNQQRRAAKRTAALLALVAVTIFLLSIAEVLFKW